jgi:hypothetical protein
MASGSTNNYSFPYPLSTDNVNVSGDIQQLAVKIDVDLKEIIEDTSGGQWSGGSFTNGVLAPTYNDSTGKFSMSLVQNLTASGSPTFISPNFTGTPTFNTELIMNSSVSGSPTQNAIFTVERGTSPNVAIRWNESEQAWQFTNDGENYMGVSSTGLQDTLMFAGM